MIERRQELRTEVELPLQVWGIDAKGQHGPQAVRAHNLSQNGALLSQIDAELRSGDVIGILYAGRKARYRVVWVRHSRTSHEIQAAVHRVEPDECPWQDLLSEEPGMSPPPITTQAP